MLEVVCGSPALACDVSGAGPPVVFLHGIGGRRRNWRGQTEALASSFTTFAWDARGYGDSADYPRPLAVSDFGDSYLKTLRASVTFDRADELASLAVPVQLIFGREDELTPPSIGEEMLEMLPDATLTVLEGVGHLSNLEDPNGFNEVLRSFLAGHRELASFDDHRERVRRTRCCSPSTCWTVRGPASSSR